MIKICLWSQNMPQFPISLLHWSQISFSGAFFWGLQTASSCWGPDLENRMSVEAVKSVIHVVLPLLRSNCDTMHCLGERVLFSSSFMGVFWRFLPSNVPIMLYNIHYWSFSLSQCNQWTKYLAHPKTWRPKHCLLMFVFLLFWMAFTCCCPLSWLPIWSRSEVVDPGFIHCHIFTQKTPFCCLETVTNNTELLMCYCFWSTVSKRSTHFEYSFRIDKYTCKMVNTLPSDIFNSSHNLNLWSAETNLWSFFNVFWNNCRIWAIWAFSIIYVCTTMFKVSIPPLNHCFWWSRVWLILFKPLLCLNNALLTHEIQMDFSLVVLSICQTQYLLSDVSQKLLQKC